MNKTLKTLLLKTVPEKLARKFLPVALQVVWDEGRVPLANKLRAVGVKRRAQGKMKPKENHENTSETQS
jgi:hypothetical protein